MSVTVSNTPLNVGNKPEDDLIFALQILASQDFFPKIRERQNSVIISNNGDNNVFTYQSSNGGVVIMDEDQSPFLLLILRNSVLRYLDDFNPDVRGTAAQTLTAVLDTIVLSLDPSSDNYQYLYQILDRLLIMGVGDELQSIRMQIFNSLTSSLDHVVSLTENVHCVIEALNDESLDVRMAAMTVISRLAHYDALRIMPVVRLTLKRLIYLLLNNADKVIKRDSVQLLQALVRGSDRLIIPYVKQVLVDSSPIVFDS